MIRTLPAWLRRHSSPRPLCRRPFRPIVERLDERLLLDASYYSLLNNGPFFQDWSDTSLISQNNDWSGVPSVVGYRGDGLASSPGVDPQGITAFAGSAGPVVDVLANHTNPNTLTTGGVAEFEISNPVVALKGSATARAPFLLFYLDTTGMTGITVSFNLRDIDGSANNAVQQIAVQYRVGENGPFTNLPSGYVPDATTGPNEAYLVTPDTVVLPPDAENQPQVQVRVMTTDAVGSDEWVGVDDVSIAGTPPGTLTLRIASYNIASSTGAPRAGLDTILAAIGSETVNGVAEPLDVLALQEVQHQATTTQDVVDLLNGIYGPGVYACGSLDGRSTGTGTQGLVYNTQTVQLLDETAVGTATTTGEPRQALRYHLQPVNGGSGTDFWIYNSHYKALDDSTSANRRLDEAEAIRADADALGPGAQILYMGDFNTYTSNEAGYQFLLSPGNGQAVDPLNDPGNWHARVGFIGIDTQAPAVSPPAPLTGGGLNDRFDFELMTGALMDGYGLDYLPGSYHTFGNNGSVRLSGSINDPSNTALPDLPNRGTVLDLLTTVADHLPVVADYMIENGSAPAVRTGRLAHAHAGTAIARPSALQAFALLRPPAVSVGFNGWDDPRTRSPILLTPTRDTVARLSEAMTDDAPATPFGQQTSSWSIECMAVRELHFRDSGDAFGLFELLDGTLVG